MKTKMNILVKLTKPIIWQHSRWHYIKKNDNKYMRKAGYDLVLRRDVAYSTLKRMGQMVTGIDAKSKELLAKYPRIQVDIDNLN